MSSFRENADRSAADAAVERALASVSHPVPRAEFLRELKTKFTSVATQEPAPEPPRELPSARLRATPSISRWAIAAGLLAVAATVLAIISLRSSHMLHWAPVDGRAPHSPLVVDGRRVEPAQLESAVADPTAAHTIVTGAEPMWVWIDRRVCCELAPESDVEFGPVPSDGLQLTITTRKGTIRVCTGPAFAGSKLDVKTAELSLAVTGTSFAVDIDDEGTCVCCLDGHVLMRAPSAFDKTWTVDGGRMCRIYHDARAPKWDALSAVHGPALAQFEEAADPLLQQARAPR